MAPATAPQADATTPNRPANRTVKTMMPLV